MAFRFRGLKVHLTYKTHVPFDKIKALMKSLRDTKMFSIVHEIGDEHEDNPTPYAHTHVFWWWKKDYDSTNARCFDIDGIHPNIKGNKGIQWSKTIVTKYHLGHKTKNDGKKYFIEPVALEQFGVEDWHFEKDLIQTIRAAPDLMHACLAADIMPKSVGDVKLLRSEKKRKFAEIEDDCDPERFKKVEWNRKKALVLKGNAASGKTNWAIHQFNQPVMINDIDDLKSLPDDCDGLVFDEMLFDKCAKKTQVYLTDLAFERTIRARNSNGTIPKGMPRIFTCNEHEFVFGEYPHESVRRRYELIDVDVQFNGKMYN